MLTKTEMTLLKFLLSKGAATDRARLVQDVLGYHPTARTNALETHVWRIRRKIEATPKSPQILQTTPGGYQLVLDDYTAGTHEWVAFVEEMATECSTLHKALSARD